MIEVDASCPLSLTLGVRHVAIGFMQTTDAPVLSCRLEDVLPIRVTTKWHPSRDSYGSMKTKGAA
jgi:hypothetical protein